MQGIIFNKMVIDTMFFLPELIPYWIKCILFFVLLTPLYLTTLFDDLVGGSIVYWRWSVNEDWFNMGIFSGKILKCVPNLPDLLHGLRVHGILHHPVDRRTRVSQPRTIK